MAKDRGKDRHKRTEHRRVYQRGYQRAYAWKRKFGLTENQIREMIERQNGACAICARRFDMDATGYGRAELFPHVDHCHESGVIRGLLCNSCNVSIGRFRECIDTMRRAIDYLIRNRQPQPKIV